MSGFEMDVVPNLKSNYTCRFSSQGFEFASYTDHYCNETYKVMCIQLESEGSGFVSSFNLRHMYHLLYNMRHMYHLLYNMRHMYHLKTLYIYIVYTCTPKSGLS